MRAKLLFEWIPCLLLLCTAGAQAQTTTIVVRDRAGTSVQGAHIEVLAGSTVAATSTTDGEGSAQLALDAGTYRARATGHGFVVGLSESFTLSAESTPTVEVALFPGSALAGTMLDDDDGRVGGAELCLSLHESSRYPPSAFGEGLLEDGAQCWKGDEQGQMATPVLPLGRYDLSIKADGLVPRRTTVNLESDHPAQTWRLTRGGTVSGLVQDQEEVPVAGATIRLRHRELEVEQEGLTTETGRFKIGGLAPGPWNVRVEPPNAAVILRDGVSVHKGVTADLGVLRVRPGLSIDGRVLGADGEPLAEVKVQVRRANRVGRPIRTVETDDEGRFLAAGLGAATVHLLVDAPEGHASTALEDIEPPQRDLQVELDETGSVCGTAVTEEGRIPRGTSVGALPDLSGLLDDHPRLIRATTTSIDPETGEFCITDVHPGENVSVTARAAGYREASSEVKVSPGEETGPVELVLKRGLTLEGTVVSQNGQPLSDAAVRARRTRMVYTDGFGEFRLTGLSEGMNTVVAEHRDYAASQREVMLPLGPEAEFRIELGPGGVIEGSVTRTHGEPVEGVPVALSDPVREQLTDADGEFRFESVPAGTRKITRKARGRYDDFEHRRVEVVEEEITRVDFTLGAVLEGLVVRGGVPVPNVGIVLAQPRNVTEYTDGNHAVQQTFSDESGAYRLSGVREGWGTVTLEDGRQTVVRQIDVPPGDSPRRDLQLPDRPIRGTVVNAVEDTGIANAHVTIDLAPTVGAPESDGSSSHSSSDASGGIRYNLTSSATSKTITDAAGNFEGYTDPLPEVNVSAWADGFRWTSVTAHPERREPVRIEMSRETKLVVKLRDAQGKPATGARVCANEIREDGRSSSCSSGGSDQVRFSLNEARYTILASATGFGTQVFERDMKPTEDGSATTITVDLVPGAALHIRLVGQPKEGAKIVSLIDPTGAERRDLVEEAAVDPATGDRRWTSWTLNPGLWNLTLDDGDGHAIQREVEVVAGPPIDVILP